MRLSGRLQAAIEVLEDIRKRRRPAADSLKDWGLAHRFAGSGDRAAIGTLVYDALRCQNSLSWRMDDNAPLALGYGALFEIIKQDEASIEDFVATLTDDPFAPPVLKDSSIAAWRERKLAYAPEEVQADIALEFIPFFKNLYGENWLIQVQALAKRAPLDLRLNILKSSKAQLAKHLSQYKAFCLPWSKDSWRIAPTIGFARHPNITATAAFQKGLFEVQDLGSQLVTHLAATTSHLQVLDYCAGGGGKTLAMAAIMENRGQIYAYDSDRMRLAPIFARLKRASVRNVQVLEQTDALEKQKGKMDLVLIDAPCSGSGTWRRHPDSKWRLRQPQLARRINEQRAILQKAQDFVKPGGRLAYVTCSLFESENNHQIADFIEKFPEFFALDMRNIWQNFLPPTAPLPIFADIGLYLSPASTNSDGFYIAILQRR